MALYPLGQGRLLGAAYRSRLCYGEGFAWISGYPSDNIMIGAGGTVDSDAAYGAVGAARRARGGGGGG